MSIGSLHLLDQQNFLIFYLSLKHAYCLTSFIKVVIKTKTGMEQNKIVCSVIYFQLFLITMTPTNLDLGNSNSKSKLL